MSVQKCFSAAAAASYTDYLGTSRKVATNFKVNLDTSSFPDSTLPQTQQAASIGTDGRAGVIDYGEEAVHVLSLPRLVADVDVHASGDGGKT